MKTKKVILTIFICSILLIIYKSIYLKFHIAIPCIFYEITGYYCPGCGVTRMIFSILNLNFYQAFRFNPLVFIFMPFICLLLIDYFIKVLKNRKDYLFIKINNKIWYVLIFLTLLFGIIRNIPAFDYLIPTLIN